MTLASARMGEECGAGLRAVKARGRAASRWPGRRSTKVDFARQVFFRSPEAATGPSFPRLTSGVHSKPNAAARTAEHQREPATRHAAAHAKGEPRERQMDVLAR